MWWSGRIRKNACGLIIFFFWRKIWSLDIRRSCVVGYMLLDDTKIACKNKNFRLDLLYKHYYYFLVRWIWWKCIGYNILCFRIFPLHLNLFSICLFFFSFHYALNIFMLSVNEKNVCFFVKNQCNLIKHNLKKKLIHAKQ